MRTLYIGFMFFGMPSLTLAQEYPLCPGSNWTPVAGPSAVAVADPFSFETAKPKAERSTLRVADEFLADEPKQFRSKTKAAPSKSAATALSSAVRSQMGNPAVVSRFNDASAAVKLLQPQEQLEAVQRSFPKAMEGIAKTGKLSVDELNDGLKRLKADAQLAGLRKAIDPSTLQAYLVTPKPASSEEELYKKLDDPLFRAFNLRISGLLQENGKVADGLGKGISEMVGTGEGVRPGGLGLVPLPQPVALDSNAGALCVRPAIPSDYMLDPVTRKIKRAWDAKGFRDVGLLLWRISDVRGNVGKTNICSFVRVGGSFAVTAAHCVIESGKGDAVRKRDFQNASVEALGLLPRLDAVDLNPQKCFDKPASCGYHVARLTTAPELPAGIAWPASSQGPSPDVALLAIPFGPEAPVAITGVASGVTIADRLTLAGYGYANAAGEYGWGSLLVGWQRSSPLIEETNLVWSVDVNNGAAGGCGGDSGGAVYEGDIGGLKNETRVLRGVISSGELPQTGITEAEKCASSWKGRAARLDIHLGWICKQSNNIVLGCPGTKLTASN